MRSLNMLLRTRGCSVDVYSNGFELLERRKPHEADCLLIDYKMPRMDGLILLRLLRAKGDETPALMITGFFSHTLRAQALEAGYAEVLEKPTAPAILMQNIADIL